MGRPLARAFDADAGAIIADLVLTSYADPGLGATRRDLKEICDSSYVEQTEEERYLERFCTSSTLLRDPEKRQ
jgi:hypothetical protein